MYIFNVSLLSAFATVNKIIFDYPTSTAIIACDRSREVRPGDEPSRGSLGNYNRFSSLQILCPEAHTLRPGSGRAQRRLGGFHCLDRALDGSGVRRENL